MQSTLLISESMEKAAAKYPQIKHEYVKVNSEAEICGVCALGAAYFGAGTGLPDGYLGSTSDRLNILRSLKDQWPFLECLVFDPYNGVIGTLEDVIVTLNDEGGWPLEAIISYVKDVEAIYGGLRTEADQPGEFSEKKDALQLLTAEKYEVVDDREYEEDEGDWDDDSTDA